MLDGELRWADSVLWHIIIHRTFCSRYNLTMALKPWKPHQTGPWAQKRENHPLKIKCQGTHVRQTFILHIKKKQTQNACKGFWVWCRYCEVFHSFYCQLRINTFPSWPKSTMLNIWLLHWCRFSEMFCCFVAALMSLHIPLCRVEEQQLA